MFIEKDNLIIRNATIQDATFLATWWNDGKIMAHTGFPNGTGQTSVDYELTAQNFIRF